jgi:hypothetical protein
MTRLAVATEAAAVAAAITSLAVAVVVTKSFF